MKKRRIEGRKDGYDEREEGWWGRKEERKSEYDEKVET